MMRVMDASPLAVELHFDHVTAPRHGSGAAHVEGTARIGDGPARPFSGWMALLQLLEELVAPRQ
jgi:hypothetical protein